jgi:hypothetical protein
VHITIISLHLTIGVVQLARKHPRLVHFAAIVVGTSNPRVPHSQGGKGVDRILSHSLLSVMMFCVVVGTSDSRVPYIEGGINSIPTEFLPFCTLCCGVVVGLFRCAIIFCVMYAVV